MSFGASTPKYLVLFYGVSSGANGANLGSDERDLVTLVYLVLNTEENKVSGMETYVRHYMDNFETNRRTEQRDTHGAPDGANSVCNADYKC